MIESRPAVEIASGRHATGTRLELYFDAQCPLCSREVSWLKTRSPASKLTFTDISAPGFDPAVTGRSLGELMGNLHARTASGEWLIGMDAIRGMYRGTGLGNWARLTELPGLRRLFDLGYMVFAIARPYLRRHARSPGACTDRCDLRVPKR